MCYNSGLHVVSDEHIVVRAINTCGFYTDAFLVPPTEELGKDYIAATYHDPANAAVRDLSLTSPVTK